jgi:signal transduction histidine kinase
VLRFFKGQRLLSRVFLHGLVVLIASALTFAVLSTLLMRPSFDREFSMYGKWMAPQLCQALANATALDSPGFAASSYSDSGALLGTFVRPPIAPLTTDQVARVHLGQPTAVGGARAVLGVACPAATGGGYVVFGPPGPPLPSARLALLFSLVVLVVALASLPFARSITKPIERVVEITRAFGRGDLAARAETARRDEVGDLALAFNDMAERLERLIRAEKELLANVSHELRTPLARIRVVLETALEKPKLAEGLLAEIATDLTDLEGLVENIMETMRLDMGSGALSGGQLPARIRATDIGALAAEAVVRFRELNRGRLVELECSPEPMEASADARLVRRLLDNLMENASKYSEADSVIRIQVTRSAQNIRVAVTDAGIGIEPQDLPHVFEPFFRSDRSRARATGGVGLGLALAKRIVDVHDGRIAIESQIGQGTTVWFELKRCAALDVGPI